MVPGMSQRHRWDPCSDPNPNAVHSSLTSHRTGLIQGAVGSTGREYNLPERPGGHRDLVRSGNAVRGSDSGGPAPQGGARADPGPDPERDQSSPGSLAHPIAAST